MNPLFFFKIKLLAYGFILFLASYQADTCGVRGINDIFIVVFIIVIIIKHRLKVAVILFFVFSHFIVISHHDRDKICIFVIFTGVYDPVQSVVVRLQAVFKFACILHTQIHMANIRP